MPKYDIKTEQGTVTIELEAPPTPDDLPALQHHIDQFFLQQSHNKNLAAGEQAEQQVENVKTAGGLIGGGLRVLGGFAGPAGAALAEPVAETVEQSAGAGPGVSLRTIPRAGLNAAISAIPGNWFGQPSGRTLLRAGVRKAIGGAVEGGTVGALANTVSPLIEGETPTPGGIAGGAITGATMGGAIQGLRSRPYSEVGTQSSREIGKALNLKSRKQFEDLAQVLPEIHAETLHKGDNFRKLGVAGFSDRAHDAANRLWDTQFKPLIAKFGGQKIDVSRVAPHMRGDISQMTLEREPQVAQRLTDAQAFYSQPRSVSEIQGYIRDLNKELKAYQETSGLKRATLLGDPHYGPKQRELDSLKDLLADHLGSVSGVDIKDIKNRYRATRSIAYIADQADEVNFARQEKQLGTKSSIGRDTAKGIESTLNFHPGTAAKRAARGFVPPPVRESYIKGDPNNPDNLITTGLVRLGNRYHNQPIKQYQGPQRKALGPAPPNVANSSAPFVGQGPYANAPGPITPNQSMEQFLDLNDVSPEAQRFLGYKPRRLLPPPETP